MTKRIERYRRWFGTKVPLISRSFIVILTLLCSLPFSVVIYYRFGYSIAGINWVIAVLLSIAVGALVHLLYLLILKFRFTNPSPNQELHNIVGRIHQRIVISSEVHIWTRQSEDLFIVSTYNPVFNAVIVSEPMLDQLLKNPESGEALLAFHLIRVPRIRWFVDLIGSAILFLIFTYASALFLVPMITAIIQMYWYSGFFFLILVSLLYSFGTLFLMLMLLVVVLKGSFWRHEPAFVAIQEIYGLHPNVAKVQVEEGRLLDEEEAQAVVWAVREWEKNKRGSRRVGISTFIAMLVFVFAILVYTRIFVPFSPYWYLFTQIMYLIPIAAWIVSYLILRLWDKKAMTEVFQKTTDYDEPIWLD